MDAEHALRFAQLLHNKRLVLFGPLPAELPPEPFDLAVHLNTHWKTGPCAILYHGCSDEDDPARLLPAIERHGVPDAIIANGCGDAGQLAVLRQWAVAGGNVFLSPQFREFQGRNPDGPENEHVNILRKRLRCFPFIGVIAINHLLLHAVADLWVTGFDFYFNPYSFTLPQRVGAHEVRPQVDFVRQTLETDARLRVDRRLHDVLYSEQAATLEQFSSKRLAAVLRTLQDQSK